MPPFAHEKKRLLSDLTTFGIGGPATFFAEAFTEQMMAEMIAWCYQNKTPYFILGKGSNILFDDRGFNGLVIQNRIDHLFKEENLFSVGAAFSFARLGMITAKEGFSGLEFASGIPASVGGAIFMNAGANGQQTQDCLKEVGYINEEGKKLILSKVALQFSYRFSSFQKWKGAIVSALFELTPSNEAKKKQEEIVSYRLKTQPYHEHSAGCVFQNPPGLSAGRLIEEAGLKGRQIGGAVVSEKHANFLVNRKQASAEDILALIKEVKETVLNKSGILLHEEVRFIPYE